MSDVVAVSNPECQGCKAASRAGVIPAVEGNMGRAHAIDTTMVFDLICRSCGACAQRAWDPTSAVSVTPCATCDAAMSVIGIDFPQGREAPILNSVLEVIQGAGIVPIAVERHARGQLSQRAA